jgi:hypothetical protein
MDQKMEFHRTIIAYINGANLITVKILDRGPLYQLKRIIQIQVIAPDGSKVIFNLSLGT